MAPVGREAALGGSVGPDGSVIIGETEDQAWLYPVGGGPPKLLKGGQKGNFAGWQSATSVFFVWNSPDEARHIDRVDLLTGIATPVGTVSIPDTSGLVRFTLRSVIGDVGRYGYSYDYTRQLSTLVVASGITLR